MYVVMMTVYQQLRTAFMYQNWKETMHYRSRLQARDTRTCTILSPRQSLLNFSALFSRTHQATLREFARMSFVSSSHSLLGLSPPRPLSLT